MMLCLCARFMQKGKTDTVGYIVFTDVPKNVSAETDESAQKVVGMSSPNMQLPSFRASKVERKADKASSRVHLAEYKNLVKKVRCSVISIIYMLFIYIY